MSTLYYTFLDHEMMYVIFDSDRVVAICSLTFDSVGIEANLKHTMKAGLKELGFKEA